jgi:hypothetical protein
MAQEQDSMPLVDYAGVRETAVITSVIVAMER